MVRMKRSAARRAPAEEAPEATTAPEDAAAPPEQAVDAGVDRDAASAAAQPAAPVAEPVEPPARAARSGIWRPGSDAALELHWSQLDDDAFAVELRLCNAGAGSAGAGSCVLRARLHADRPALAFALRQAGAPTPFLSGCLERRSDGGGSLWLSGLRGAGARAAAACISAAR